MNKLSLIKAIDEARLSKKLTKKALAQITDVNVKSIDNALSPAGNPQMSTLLALVDAVGLEIELVPKGFGELSSAVNTAPSVLSVVDAALGRGHP